MKTRKTLSISAALSLSFGLLMSFTSASVSAGEYYNISNGELEQPTGYRQWVYVGTPVTPNDMNNGKAAFPEFHNVYIDPKSWAHWKKTGRGFGSVFFVPLELPWLASPSDGGLTAGRISRR